jgi:hypothetical protein
MKIWSILEQNLLSLHPLRTTLGIEEGVEKVFMGVIRPEQSPESYCVRGEAKNLISLKTDEIVHRLWLPRMT